MPRQKKPDWKKCLDDQEILTGLAKVCDRRKSGNGFRETLKVDTGGYTVYIRKEDAVMYYNSTRLSRLVGMQVKFCIKEIVPATIDEEEKVYGSMKEALDRLISPIKERMESGTIEKGIVLNATQHGARIAVGDLIGYMKNSDYIDNGEEIRDYLQKGSEINVKLKKISDTGFIYFLPETKRKAAKKVKRKDIAVGMVMAGTITKAYPDRVYVRVLPNIEVMCFNEQSGAFRHMGELREGDEVQVRIKSMKKPGNWLMVRGKVMGKVPGMPIF